MAARQVAAAFDLDDLPAAVGEASGELRGRAGMNVVLVLFVAVGLQILAVTVAVSLFHIVFGPLTVPDTLAAEWIGRAPPPLSSSLPDSLSGLPVVSWFGENLSVELLRAAVFVGTFGGLQVAISATTDQTYRADFLGQVTDEVREAVAASSRLRAMQGPDVGERPSVGPDQSPR